MTARRPIRDALRTVLVLAIVARFARAQESTTSLTGDASAIVLLTHATGTPRARSLTEAYLTQPMVNLGLRASWFQAIGILNLEGLTLARGELDLGAWGEGFVDRRHPHAYLHELMAGAMSKPGPLTASMYAGRGFVPFGSDDPMTRPFVSYPVDHHLAQVLERLILVGAARGGPVAAEAAIFDGDEPLDPSTPPLTRRFGDSWSLRGTLFGEALSSVLGGAELAASYAKLKSPEYREGHGLDQRKLHVDLRFHSESGPFARYALIEAARTTDVDRGRDLYTFDALLGEGGLCLGDAGIAARWERSDRPEEERLLDLFRSARPATDASILGVTRWTTLSAAVGLPPVSRGAARAIPFIEVSRITADRTTAAVFDPVLFYGSNLMWRLSAGIRVAAGHAHGRMGRYGVASELPADSTPPTAHEHHPLPTRRCFL